MGISALSNCSTNLSLVFPILSHHFYEHLQLKIPSLVVQLFRRTELVEHVTHQLLYCCCLTLASNRVGLWPLIGSNPRLHVTQQFPALVVGNGPRIYTPTRFYCGPRWYCHSSACDLTVGPFWAVQASHQCTCPACIFHVLPSARPIETLFRVLAVSKVRKPTEPQPAATSLVPVFWH